MSSKVNAGEATAVDLSPQDLRAAFNPFEHGCWLDFANKLTQGYMAAEHDEWAPLADHHGEWIRHLAGTADVDGDLVLLCHRDGLKTTIVSAFTIACLEYLDGYRVIWTMNTRDQAFEKADRELNRMIERNSWLTHLNRPREEDSKKTKVFENGSSLTTGWLDGGIEGSRAHLLILDDIIKEKGDGGTQEVINWVDGVTQPMVKEDGRTVMVGTRKRPDDIYSHYRSYEGYELREFPAILDIWDQEFRDDDDWRTRRPAEEYYTEVEDPWREGQTLQLLWPEARGPEWLADKRSKIADYLFWREYTLTIRGASGNLVDADAVNAPVEQGGCSIRDRTPPQQYRAGRGESIVVGHDPANSPTGDDCAFSVWLRRRGGERVLLDARSEPGLSPSTVKAQLATYDRRYDPATIIIESNGIQGYIVEDAIEFDSQLAAKVQGLDTGSQKHSWENGIPRLRTLVENGMVQFYRGHGPTEDFVTAMQSLELDNGRLEGHTPDLVASWYMAEKALRRFDGRGDRDDDSNGVSYL